MRTIRKINLERYVRKNRKQWLRKRCKQLGIKVPGIATLSKLNDAYGAYMMSAVVVQTKDGVKLAHTDKPIALYTVEFMIRGNHIVVAEDFEAACEFVESNLERCYDIGGHGYVKIIEREIVDCLEEELTRGDAFLINSQIPLSKLIW